jgi:IS5 family transposase
LFRRFCGFSRNETTPERTTFVRFRRGRDERETLARLDAWSAPIHRVRARIEKIIGTWRRCYGLRRMRWRGLARAAAQAHLAATAYNLKRGLNILSA